LTSNRVKLFQSSANVWTVLKWNKLQIFRVLFQYV
jgi:hypothetical protein